MGLKILYYLSMELDDICGPIVALVCLFANLEANTNVNPFIDVVCKEFSVRHEKHGYGCPRGLYTSEHLVSI